jgi:predicted kinase
MRSILVFLISGVSGAGKSTYVKSKLPGAMVVSADDYFTDKQGAYHFNPGMLGKAHGEALLKFADALRLAAEGDLEEPAIVVDNTFTTALELAPYVALANAYGITPTLTTLYLPFQVAAHRNVHNVPEQGVRHQWNRLQARELPAFWSLRKEDLHWSESHQSYMFQNAPV